VGGGVQVGPLGTVATNRPIVPAPGDYDDGEICGMIRRGNRITWRKHAPVPLCPPQTPHSSRTRTQAAAVGSQWLTAWATPRPLCGTDNQILLQIFGYHDEGPYLPRTRMYLFQDLNIRMGHDLPDPLMDRLQTRTISHIFILWSLGQ
jgi:hypothetical protein